MNLSEDEKRMVYQIEGTDQIAALNEVYMTWRYANSQHEGHGGKRPKKAASPAGPGVHGRDPGGTEERTVGELQAEARQKSGAQKLAGHDIMALERFAPTPGT